MNSGERIAPDAPAPFGRRGRGSGQPPSQTFRAHSGGELGLSQVLREPPVARGGLRSAPSRMANDREQYSDLNLFRLFLRTPRTAFVADSGC
jgi:hypothetical protein